MFWTFLGQHLSEILTFLTPIVIGYIKRRADIAAIKHVLKANKVDPMVTQQVLDCIRFTYSKNGVAKNGEKEL